MREIKARVWDNTCKCWLKDFVIYKQGNVSSDGVWLQKKEAIIELYTGLKDKNGKEIYEGDILKGDHNPNSRKPPVEHDIVIWKGSGWKRESYNGEMKVHPDIDCRPMEVIGNIHENKDLQ